MTILAPAPVIEWTNEELAAQFRRCEVWQDADQWEALGFLYYSRGYMMNAGYCFRKCDELLALAVEPERQTIIKKGE